MLLNRALSGIAPVTDAGSSQSRADVIAIVLSASCVLTGKRVFAINLILLLLQKKKASFCVFSLTRYSRGFLQKREQTRNDSTHIYLYINTGLQWSSIKARVYPKVEQGGLEIEYFDESLSRQVREEIQWCYDALIDSSSTCGLVVFHKGKCAAQLGFAADDSSYGSQATMGPMCKTMIERDKGNYIPNLKVYPGRIEFTYLPDTVQALIMQPLGDEGVMLVCSDTQRGFTKVDQSWISTISEKLDVSLSSSSDGE